MFIVNPEPDREGRTLLKIVKRKFGFVPPHWKLFAALNPVRFKMFLDEINYLTTHPRIEKDFFTFLRYAVAYENGFEYCIRFNRQLLLSLGYAENEIHSLENSEKKIPLDERHQRLFTAALQAMNKPRHFTAETIQALTEDGWNHTDVFDAVDHAAFLFKFARILQAYLRENEKDLQ